jgi:hypothetical protein
MQSFAGQSLQLRDNDFSITLGNVDPGTRSASSDSELSKLIPAELDPL